MNKNWKMALLLLAAAGSLTIAGCGEAPKKEASQSVPAGRVLTVATEGDYAPLSFKDEHGHAVGFELDLAKAVAKEMNADIKVETMHFGEIISAVKNKKVDMGISAITIRDERKEHVTFSDPYYKMSGYSIIVKKDSGLRGEGAIKGKTVATLQGSTSEAKVKELGPAKIKSMGDYNRVFDAVEKGEADAGITDEPASIYGLKAGRSSKLTIVGLIPAEDNFGIAVSKDNQKLADEVNQALKKIMSDGTYDALSQKWFFEDKAVEKK